MQVSSVKAHRSPMPKYHANERARLGIHCRSSLFVIPGGGRVRPHGLLVVIPVIRWLLPMAVTSNIRLSVFRLSML
jgi:hypothetical protein